MFDFMDKIRDELLENFIDILDVLSVGSLHLYDKITDNLIHMLRKKFRKPICKDKFLV